MSYFLDTVWPPLVLALHVTVGTTLSAWILLRRHDERAAVAWIGLVWLSPFLGGLLYLLFGINRVSRRAVRIRPARRQRPPPAGERLQQRARLRAMLGSEKAHLESLVNVVDALTQAPLSGGNAVTPLIDGEQAFPAMIEAIENARASVGLVTYIFNADAAGRRFVAALARAVARGVEVRVLVDGVGALYSYPSIMAQLRRNGIPGARFLHSLVPWRVPYLNIRNHQKILVVDGRVGFTGGINIKAGHLLEARPRFPTRGLHFRVTGPAVGAMTEAFADDWAFTTDELLEGAAWFPALAPAGGACLRAIPSGPDERVEKLEWALLGAINSAESSVRIVTPYFLPDRPLLAALRVAALRGLAVDIVLPERSNLRFVDWARASTLEELLGAGCRVWFQPAPFDHAKILLVDGYWALFGSTNWDARSLRLNFEFNMECYDAGLASALDALIAGKIAHARACEAGEIAGRGLAVKLRDGIARLFSPYL